MYICKYFIMSHDLLNNWDDTPEDKKKGTYVSVYLPITLM